MRGDLIYTDYSIFYRSPFILVCSGVYCAFMSPQNTIHIIMLYLFRFVFSVNFDAYIHAVHNVHNIFYAREAAVLTPYR